jgi:hypothetical protein
MALAVIGPTPGIVARRRLASLARCQARMPASAFRNARLGLPDPDLEEAELLDKHVQRAAGQLRHLLPGRPQRLDQPGHLPRTLRRDEAEFAQVAAQRVDQRRALADEQVARLVQHQHGLLLGGLDRHGRKHCFRPWSGASPPRRWPQRRPRPSCRA